MTMATIANNHDHDDHDGHEHHGQSSPPSPHGEVKQKKNMVSAHLYTIEEDLFAKEKFEELT